MRHALGIVALSLIGTGCGTSLQFMPLNRPPHALRPRGADEVEVFTRPPPRPSVEVGLIEGQQSSAVSLDEAADVLRRMRVRAGREGCDALVLLGSNDRTAVSGGPWGVSADTLRGYRASCIVYREEG